MKYIKTNFFLVMEVNQNKYLIFNIYIFTNTELGHYFIAPTFNLFLNVILTFNKGCKRIVCSREKTILLKKI